MAKLKAEILIFDVDGVLVNVNDSYHRAILETVRRFTGKRVERDEIQRWKCRPSYNNDWKLTFEWIRSRGGQASYREVTSVFQKLYRGRNFSGFIRHERWLASRRLLSRLARRYELAIFTGRPRREVLYTLKRFGVSQLFKRIVALEDVRESKPSPEGLRRILNGRSATRAVYLGDNVDDALAARRAGVMFLGVLPPDTAARKLHLGPLRRLGARAVLRSVAELERWLA
jgi:HAD superfamily phosphatase